MPEKIVLDLETKKGFDEVAGRNLKLLGVSLAGIYSYQDDQFKVFAEKDLKLLLPYLQRAELVIGFNIKGFDYPVLQPYLDFDLTSLNTLDMLEEIHKTLGFRLSLESIARATLEIGKIGTGLDALKYFRRGEMDRLARYCRHDVFVTREIYEYGRRHGHLVYRRQWGLQTIPVRWAECQSIEQIIKEAFAKRRTVEIEYSSAGNNIGRKRLRQIDIYSLELGRIIAYCHLRRDMRTFNIRRILSAKLTTNSYQIPSEFKLQDFKARQK